MTSKQADCSADLVQVTVAQLASDVSSRLARTAKALGDPQRVEILHLLSTAAGPVCVLDLEHHLDLAQSTVSHHLKVLVDAGVCEREPRGRWTYYSILADVLADFRHEVERLVHFPGQLRED
jgi:ArsR family transcriptional regulator, arsenate/arsenite/antimonite-responsive transcriptional repressor